MAALHRTTQERFLKCDTNDAVTWYVCDYRWGMDWIMDFLKQLELQVLATLSLIPKLYKSPANAKSSSVFTSGILETEFNTNYTSLTVTTEHRKYSFHSRTLATTSSQPDFQLLTNRNARIVFFITTWHRPNRKHSFQQWRYCCRRVFTDPLLRNGLHNIIVLLLCACMLRELPSNGRCLQSHRLAADLYAIILKVGKVGCCWIAGLRIRRSSLTCQAKVSYYVCYERPLLLFKDHIQ
jgi:hypothetical protein